MYRCVPYTEEMKEAWDRLAGSQGTIYHTLAFRKILCDTFGYRCLYHAIVDRNNDICALLPLISGRNLGLEKVGVSLPFINYLDICAIDEEAANFAMAAIADLKENYQLSYVELRFKNETPTKHDKLGPINLSNHTFVLPLTTEDEVLALSSSSNRNHVRKVYKNNWFTASYDKGNLESFHRVYVRRMKQLGSPAQDISFFQRFLDNFPGQAELLTVIDVESGEVVGGMLLLKSPGNSTLYYPYGANLTAYNHKYLNNFMYWEAVKLGIRSGMKKLDLGRSQTGSGTYKYKEQWGAKAEQLTYYVMGSTNKKAGPPDKEKLRFFVELWKVMPNFVTEPIGKQLIKYLMP
ncbi:GNAT family N-acetyltransferase [Paenibacillus qinlingensis]|uniref:BioF2-like acetyltransferase domain-containing protein n=1 Tax=Paenibacillus qinlingensis TaxID=1837343 RepID=A0ABU1NXS4_9BACL|nr:GNAT family N-acetyltransferase [Paenibacillus qinlingensis]MDR6552300.1 hypothetical protein [Paenibacillus qinlingensis]